MEVWKVIPDTDGKLLVSNTGKIKSLLRDERILKTQRDRKGYHRLRVTINREKRAYKVHRLVAEAFIPNPERKPQVNHINGNKSDNSAGNLEWVTNKENCYHARDTGLWDSVIAGAIKENDSRKKAVIATDCRGVQQLFESVSAAERAFNSRHISDVLKGKRKSVCNQTFRYAQEGGEELCRN